MLYNKIPNKIVDELGAAVVYHWWDMSSVPVQKSSNPIIPAIASLRAVNRQVPIYVLDSSGFIKDWGGYPDKFDFYVIKWPFEISSHMALGDERNDMSLSILLDVWRFAKEKLEQGLIVYCDCDTFWFEDGLPVDLMTPNHINVGADDGIVCFNKNDEKIELFFDLFKAYSITALHNEAFFNSIVGPKTRVMNSPVLCRKNIMNVIKKERPYLFNALPGRYVTGSQMASISNPRFVHMDDMRMLSRGETLVLYQELYDNIEKADLMNEADWTDIYGAMRFQKLQQWQISIDNEIFRSMLAKRMDMKTCLSRAHKTVIRNV